MEQSTATASPGGESMVYCFDVTNERYYLSFSLSLDNYYTMMPFIFLKTAIVICIPAMLPV